MRKLKIVLLIEGHQRDRTLRTKIVSFEYTPRRKTPLWGFLNVGN